jgi:vacuolar-type H+-ATPase subunit B/Vma2
MWHTTERQIVVDTNLHGRQITKNYTCLHSLTYPKPHIFSVILSFEDNTCIQSKRVQRRHHLYI